ncbi:DUF6233 domain-containing protein [Streptomyces sp. NPDC059783]|uniref:DUF6233 domain-containing protein n=1 Tax=Streptomyces sp. NPDC059783 TaxID=3346944 RepID=UPI00364763C6
MPPSDVHGGQCNAAGKRRRVIDRNQAPALLADGTRACMRCRPDDTPGWSSWPGFASGRRCCGGRGR